MKEEINMVRQQIERRGIHDPAVLAAMRKVPRRDFVLPKFAAAAYEDSPLPTDCGQTISQPYIVALMTEMLHLTPGDKVLEIGTGSGYQAAVLAEIAREVYTVEIIRELHIQARERLRDTGYNNVFCKYADGAAGWLEHAPFNAIIVTAATPRIPGELVSQLIEGGRMVIPLGETYGVQTLCLIEKHNDDISIQRGIAVRFVPLTRAD